MSGCGSLSVRQMQEAIEDTVFPDELLQLWAATERSALQHAASSHHQPTPRAALPPAARGAAIWFLTHLAHFTGTGLTHYIFVFDLYVKLACGEDLLERLPEVMAATFSIVHKLTQVERCTASVAIGKAADALAQWIRETGLCKSAGTRRAQNLADMEHEVLRTLQWRVDLPSVEAWMQAYVARLSAVSQGLLAPYLESILKQGTGLAVDVMHHLTVQELPPQRLARGLLCQGLVVAGVLHIDFERLSSQLPAGQAEHGDLRPVASKWNSVPTCCLPEHVKGNVLALLAIPLGAGREALEQDYLLSVVASRVRRF